MHRSTLVIEPGGFISVDWQNHDRQSRKNANAESGPGIHAKS
jgi:hypothetical protein